MPRLDRGIQSLKTKDMGAYYVYILASQRNGTLYIGVTNDMRRRTYEHKHGSVPGFTKKHYVKRLVYYETHDEIAQAIHREKRLKEWQRSWKIDLIESVNPEWNDLFETLNF